MVAPQEPGSALGEPTGPLDGLVLRSENLRLDCGRWGRAGTMWSWRPIITSRTAAPRAR
jgi:hypothetical protein